MRAFSLVSLSSGLDLGVYMGETEAEAVEAYARDAGYEDAAAAARFLGIDSLMEDLGIDEIEAAA